MDCFQKKVSVIIPVYNVEKYLDRCLKSVVSQIYSNLEILLVNEGSTDDSAAICEKYAQEDERIVVVHQENKGLSGARNTGIEKATGQYLCFVDSDDYIEPDLVAFAMEGISKFDVRMFAFSHFFTTETTERADFPGWSDRGSTVMKKSEAMGCLTEDKILHNYACGKLYEASLFKDIKFPVGKNFEDLFIMHEIFELCDRIGFSLRPLYHYCQRNDSITHQYSCKNILDHFDALHQRTLFFEENHRELIPLQNTKCMESVLWLVPHFKESGASSKAEYLQYRARFEEYIKMIGEDYNVSHEPFVKKKYCVLYRLYKIDRKVLCLLAPVLRKTARFLRQIKR